MTNPWAMALGCWLAIGGLAGAAAGELPQPLSGGQAGLSGVVVRLGTTDGAAELELARGGRAIVQGLALTDQAVAKAQASLSAQRANGVVTVYRPLSLASLPYADNLVNTLIADLDQLAEQAPPREEILRVLIPGGTAWLKKEERWEKVNKPLRKGADAWTHFYHDAGGNPVSDDDLVGPPTGLQWIAGVATAGADPTTGYRLGEGRAVYEWRPPLQDKRDPITWLICRDAYNGTLLWSKPTSVSPYKTRPIILADGRVFTQIEAEGPIVALDAATGEVVTTFEAGGRGSRPQGGRLALNAVWHDGLLIETADDTVYVLDGRSGELRWKFAGPAGSFMDYPTVLVGTNQLFVTNGATPRDVGRYPGADARHILAFDLQTGKEQWRQALGNEVSQLSISDGALYAFNLSGFIGRRRELFIARLDPRDGAIKWRLTPEHRGQLLDMAVVGKRLYVMSLGMEVYDTETGEQVAKYSMPGNSRCDMSRASKNYLLMSFGNFVDLSSDPLSLERAEISRSTCGGGTTPGYGMLFYTPNRCQCFVSLRGFLAASRETLRQPVPA